MHDAPYHAKSATLSHGEDIVLDEAAFTNLDFDHLSDELQIIYPRILF
jgi:hypothetical protein